MFDKSIRWVAFDAVGTLIFADPPVHIAYYRVGRKYGSASSPEEVRTRFRQSYARHAAALDERGEILGDCATSQAANAPGIHDGEADEREFWRRIVGEVFPDVADTEGCFEELFGYFANPRAWSCFADVEEAFSELRQRGYRLSVASNFDSRLHRIIEGLPELRGIEKRVISSEVGCRKPSAAFYRELLQSCGCGPDELLLVGDDPVNDIEGAQRMGIGAMRIDRRAEAGERSLRFLTDILQKLP